MLTGLSGDVLGVARLQTYSGREARAGLRHSRKERPGGERVGRGWTLQPIREPLLCTCRPPSLLLQRNRKSFAAVDSPCATQGIVEKRDRMKDADSVFKAFIPDYNESLPYTNCKHCVILSR